MVNCYVSGFCFSIEVLHHPVTAFDISTMK